MPTLSDNGINFSDINQTSLVSNGLKLSGGAYQIDDDGNIIHKNSNNIINAIDIDWNNAKIPGIEDKIQTTGKLLQLIGLLYNSNVAILEQFSILQSKIESIETTQIPSNILEQLESLNERITSIETTQIPSDILERLEAINDRIDLYHAEYSIEYDLVNVIKVSGVNIMKKTDVITATFSVNTGYLFPDEIEVDGATYSYNKNNGTVIISNPTKKNILISIHANNLRQCIFNIPTLTNLSCSLVDSSKNTFVLNETFYIKLTLTGDSNYWKLPSSFTVSNCSKEEYDPLTGIAKLKCSGTGNMTISASAQQLYKFNIPTLTNLRCDLLDSVNAYDTNDIVNIKLVLTGDSNYWRLPTSISGSCCTVSTYDSTTGIATLKCSGTGNMTISASAQQRYKFTTPSLTNLSVTLLDSVNAYDVNDTVNIRINVIGDTDLFGLPTSITGRNCTVSIYNSTTGVATLKCSGTGDMTVTANAKDVASYYFAVALETNSIFTRANNTITNCNIANIESIPGYMKSIGSCPINFTSGFDAHSSVDVENKYVWFIIPSKYFNKNNFNFINGSNKYLLKQSFLQDLTTETKIKDCVTIPVNNTNAKTKIEYVLVCVSDNGLTGKQEFKKI